MLRISEFDWPTILFNRAVALFLGVSALLSGFAGALIYSDFDINLLHGFRFDAVSLIGSAGVFGFISLLICMSFFWLRCDSSRKGWKTFWFLVLLLGFPIGSPILYYAIVYLPAVLREHHVPESKLMLDPDRVHASTVMRLGPFRRSLLMGWALLVLPVASAIFLPFQRSYYFGIVVSAFVLWSAIVVLEAVIFAIVSVYRSGMTRPAREDKSSRSH